MGAVGPGFTACFDLTVSLRDIDAKKEAIWKRWAYKPAVIYPGFNKQTIHSTSTNESVTHGNLSLEPRIEAPSTSQAGTPTGKETTRYATDGVESGTTRGPPEKASLKTASTPQPSPSSPIVVFQPPPQAEAPFDRVISPSSPSIDVQTDTDPERPNDAPKPRSLFRRGMQAGKDALTMLMANQPDVSSPRKRSIEAACASPIATAKRKRIR